VFCSTRDQRIRSESLQISKHLHHGFQSYFTDGMRHMHGRRGRLRRTSSAELRRWPCWRLPDASAPATSRERESLHLRRRIVLPHPVMACAGSKGIHRLVSPTIPCCFLVVRDGGDHPLTCHARLPHDTLFIIRAFARRSVRLSTIARRLRRAMPRNALRDSQA
jgi:hypothetical protein